MDFFIVYFISSLPRYISNLFNWITNLYLELIFIYPYSLINVFFMIRIIIGWRNFSADKFKSKPYKMESNWWLEYKQNLFYFVFAIELFLYSNCFWQFYNVNLCFILVWFFFFNWLFGFISSSMKERWLIRSSFLCFYFFKKINFIVFFLLQITFILIFIHFIFFSIKEGSCLFLSLLFLFFRVIDFFIYFWLKKSWPLFKEVDEGEFFELFDSFSVTEKPLEKESQEDKSLIFNNLIKHNSNHLMCTPYSKPINILKDVPLFDYWGVEGGNIRWREKYYDEHEGPHDLYLKRALANVWREPLIFLDPSWKKSHSSRQKNIYCLPFNLVDSGFLLKRLGPKIYFDPQRTWNIKKIAPIYNELESDFIWKKLFLFPTNYYDCLIYLNSYCETFDHPRYRPWLNYNQVVYCKYLITWEHEIYMRFLLNLILSPYTKTLFYIFPISNFELIHDTTLPENTTPPKTSISLENVTSPKNTIPPEMLIPLESIIIPENITYLEKVIISFLLKLIKNIEEINKNIEEINKEEDDEEDKDDIKKQNVLKNKLMFNKPKKNQLSFPLEYPLEFYLFNHLQAFLVAKPINKKINQFTKESYQINTVYQKNVNSLCFKNINEGSFPMFRLNSIMSNFFEEHSSRLDVLDLIGFLGVVLLYDLSVLRFRNFFLYLRFVWLIGRWDRLFFRSNLYFFNQRDFFILFFYNSEKKLKD